MPKVMQEYGIHSGGPQDEAVVCPSCQASASSTQLFQAKKPQNRQATRSASRRRTRLAPGGSTAASASIPTWPRRACVHDAEAKVAPTNRNVDNSSCQSLAMPRK